MFTSSVSYHKPQTRETPATNGSQSQAAGMRSNSQYSPAPATRTTYRMKTTQQKRQQQQEQKQPRFCEPLTGIEHAENLTVCSSTPPGSHCDDFRCVHDYYLSGWLPFCDAARTWRTDPRCLQSFDTEIRNMSSANVGIPRIIHQIWIGPAPMPDIWIDTFRKDYVQKFPDFKHNLYDLSDFRNTSIWQLLQWERSPHGRSDIIRYYLLEKYGGIYVDADSAWLSGKGLSLLTNASCPVPQRGEAECFAAHSPGKSIFANGVIGCKPQSKLIQSVMQELLSFDTLEKWQNYTSNLGPWQYGGPLLLDKHAGKHPPCEYPSYYFYPESWHKKWPVDYHTRTDVDLPADSIMFQYGYTTNTFQAADFENLSSRNVSVPSPAG